MIRGKNIIRNRNKNCKVALAKTCRQLWSKSFLFLLLTFCSSNGLFIQIFWHLTISTVVINFYTEDWLCVCDTDSANQHTGISPSHHALPVISHISPCPQHQSIRVIKYPLDLLTSWKISYGFLSSRPSFNVHSLLPCQMGISSA